MVLVTICFTCVWYLKVGVIKLESKLLHYGFGMRWNILRALRCWDCPHWMYKAGCCELARDWRTCKLFWDVHSSSEVLAAVVLCVIGALQVIPFKLAIGVTTGSPLGLVALRLFIWKSSCLNCDVDSSWIPLLTGETKELIICAADKHFFTLWLEWSVPINLLASGGFAVFLFSATGKSFSYKCNNTI